MTEKRQFAFIRQLQKGSGANLKTFADIKSAERHARRLDNKSKERQRDGADHADNYFWSSVGLGLDGGGADYVDAYKVHKLKHGVKSERKGAALAAHALVGVSPEWLQETGNPHDLNNPRVKALIEASKDWVESWAGKDMVWAVRYDVDEEGSGVVDVLASPVRMEDHKSGSSKPKISINKANNDLLAQVNERLKDEWVSSGKEAEDYKPVMKSFRAMQDSWAWYAQERLSKTLERGDYIEQTRREHLYPEEFKDALNAKDEFALQAAADLEDFVNRENDLARQQAEFKREKLKQAEDRKKLDDEIEANQRISIELKQKNLELSKLEKTLAELREDIDNAQGQAAQILKEARNKASDLTKEAIERVRAFVVEATSSWAEFKKVPQPFVEMKNRYDSLWSVVTELFAKLEIGDNPKYREQIAPDELGVDGVVPLVEDLLEARATKAAKQTENVIQNISSPTGPSF